DRPWRSETTLIPLPACFSKPSGNGSARRVNLAKLTGSPSEKQELTISKTSTCVCLSACGPASRASPDQEKHLWARETFTKDSSRKLANSPDGQVRTERSSVGSRWNG